jgi:phosphatidylethanolamine/phosphatidyl-N-methylethanolamine N-methyltransferase
MSSGTWTFFQAFLKSPKVVASMIPSSPFLERRLVRAARLDSASTVVELGSGTGGTTRALLKAMPDGSNLLTMERTGEFVTALNRIGDPRLHIVHGCASTLATELESRGLGPADAVISGIPFSTLPPDLCKQIITAVHDALRPQGRFVAYQFSDRVADYARPIFGSPRIEHEVRNVPPLKVFTWEKAADSAAA